MSTLDEVAQERLRAWAGSVKRLIESAPIRAVVEEVGLAESGHSTPPERRAIRDQAQATVDRWLERDLAIIAGGRHGTPAGRVIPHVWRGGGWRRHVVSWSGGYVAGKWTGHRHCLEPRCEINVEEARRG